MFARRCLLALAVVTLSGTAAQAVDLPSPALPARIKVLVVNKGKPIAGTGTIRDLADYDRVAFILIGSGNATLEVTDIGNPGDTINVYCQLISLFPTIFADQAVSPDSVKKDFLSMTLGVLLVDIGYLEAINATPLDYGYTLKF